MHQERSKLGVAIVGCGTVGGAVATLLTRDADILRARLAPQIELRHIVDVDFTHASKLSLDRALFREDLTAALTDESVEVVVELVGGTTVAKEIIERAIRAGKHVVTANKALLAHCGPALWGTARDSGVCIAFEASCCGGVPIIRALCDGLIANRIDALYGIVNGTCNSILTAMTQRGESYADALDQAQRDGLAEADPTLDVAGTDSAHKLAILAALAFGRQIDFDAIPVEGIDSLDRRDVQYGKELGYVIKLLAIAERQDGGSGTEGVSLRVRPVFIAEAHPLARVSGAFNAVSVFAHATGHTMYYGRGAGAMPTASAVVADIASVATGVAQRSFEQLKIWADLSAPAKQLPIDAVRSRYYIRITCEDRPGVLAKIAAVLGDHDISISSVLQHEAPSGAPAAPVPVIITTHLSVEGQMRKALDRVDALDAIKDRSICIAIVEEYPEQLD